jgi:SAM-dependent methyltransferase
MRAMIDRVSAWNRAVRRPATASIRTRGVACGLRDMIAAGWFQAATGELFTGFPIGPSDTHLDVGCGDGGATLFAARQGSRVIATDVQPDKLVALGQQLAAAGATAYECIVSDTNPLPLPDETATRITCSEVLEHVPDPESFMSELVRVGAAGALYLLTVPDPASEAVQRELAGEVYWRPPNHVRIFEREAFATLVADAGLAIEARHSVGFYTAIWWALFWSAGQELGEAEQPLVAGWTAAWERVLAHPDGLRIKQALDRCLPKSQIIIARKPERIPSRRLASTGPTRSSPRHCGEALRNVKGSAGRNPAEASPL